MSSASGYQRSFIIPGAKYQSHSKGRTLSCRGYDLLMSLCPGRLTNRDPIKTEEFLSWFDPIPADIDPKRAADLRDFQTWMSEIEVTPDIVPRDYRTVCPPFLVGDCLPFRKGEPCFHGHPDVPHYKFPLTNNSRVLDGGEVICFKDKSVKVSRIVGFRLPADNEKNHIQWDDFPELLVGPERDEGPKPCRDGQHCTRQQSCHYFHPPEHFLLWEERENASPSSFSSSFSSSSSERRRMCFYGRDCSYRWRCKFSHSEEDRAYWKQKGL